MVKGFVNALNRLSKNRIFQHILFWSLSFLILTNIFKVSAEIKRIDLIYTAIFHVPILLIVYLNLRFLFPLFLETRRYLLYGLSVLILISAGAGFYIILFDNWIDYIFSGYYFIAYYGFFDISLYFVIYIFVTSLLRLARGWFHLQEIEKEKTVAELKALKSQINPHFLFNSLNSIYSLARKNSSQVPEKVIQLSDLMRHIIYDSDVEFILLPKEIEMIRNYIVLQNLRTPENEKIELEVIGEIEGKKVAPLIFLPFLENSFKHGLKSGAENPYVKIKIEVLPNDLIFEIENSKGKTTEMTDSKYKGIGIENVKKRLGLIYPNQHSLNISETENSFKVVLQIKLN
jgi:sensor histidine kinase YesM